MKLRAKIIFIISSMLAVTVIAISSITIYSINKKGQEDLANFEENEFENIQTNLKDIVEVAAGVIETQHQKLENDDYVLKYIKANKLDNADSAILAMSAPELLSLYGVEAKNELMQQALKNLSNVRFDDGEGYFWVTDNTLPYPTMLMHASKPQNVGKVMSDEKYNTEKYDKENIYKRRVELCKENGQGFVEYIMNKPGSDTVFNKLSYSKLYEPVGWVISTGIYTDQVQAAVTMRSEHIKDQRNEAILYIILASLLILSTGIAVTFYFSTLIVKGVNRVKDTLSALSLGHEVSHIRNFGKDEIGQMTSSLNDLVDGNKNYISFAKEIGNGNLDYSFKTLSEEDALGNELIKMRDNLVKSADDEGKRSWTTEGLAKFSEILRRNNTNITLLGDEVLSALVDYLKINQGGLYILNDDDKDEQYVEMVACYAYSRKKHLHKRIEIGEGLVGQCYLERQPIFLKQVPREYVNITSGLGDAPPSFVAIMPLMYNDEMYGVLEIAAFNCLEPHETDFLEKLCESIASTVSTVKVNEKTKGLLEESQKMAEELRSQEEELRQNQEEIQATQEEMTRRQSEIMNENELLKQELGKVRTQTVSSN
ncbi:MAG: cache domain-containing protein [Bacteroidota bacterium]